MSNQSVIVKNSGALSLFFKLSFWVILGLYLLFWIFLPYLMEKFQFTLRGMQEDFSVPPSLQALLFSAGLLKFIPLILFIRLLAKMFDSISLNSIFPKKLSRFMKKLSIISMVYLLGAVVHETLSPLFISLFDNQDTMELVFRIKLEHIETLILSLILGLFSRLFLEASFLEKQNQLTV